MDLLQVIIPHPSNFHILIDNDKRVEIADYVKINMDFCKRPVFEDGKKLDITAPMIVYYVKILGEEREKLYDFFDDDIGLHVVRTKQVSILIGENEYKYKFNAWVTYMPPSLFTHRDENNVDLSSFIKVELKLEHTNISLFDDVVEKGCKLERCEILDFSNK